MLVAPVALIVTPVSVQMPFATVGLWLLGLPPFGVIVQFTAAPLALMKFCTRRGVTSTVIVA